MIETYEDLPDASNDEVMDFLAEQIDVVLRKADMKRRIFVACFNTILAEVRKRMGEWDKFNE
jgi:hypothetical protein